MTDKDTRINAYIARLTFQRDNFANEIVNLYGELAILSEERDALLKKINSGNEVIRNDEEN